MILIGIIEIYSYEMLNADFIYFFSDICIIYDKPFVSL